MSARSIVSLWKVFVVVVAAAGLSRGVAVASPRARVVPDRSAAPDAPRTAAVCGGGENRCYAHVRITEAGEISPAAAPGGLTPARVDLWKLNPYTPFTD